MLLHRDFLEKRKEKLQKFYSEFHDHEKSFRHNDTILMLFEGSKEYAQLGIKSLITLNGGALIFLPAFVEVFDIKNMANYSCSALFYVAGLISIIVCILFAYISMGYSMRAVGEERNKSYSEYMVIHFADFYGNEYKDTVNKEIEEAKNKYRTLYGKSQFYEILSIVLALFSLTFFVLGCLKIAEL